MKTKSTLFALVAGLAMATSANGMVIVAGWYEFKGNRSLQTSDEPSTSAGFLTFGAGTANDTGRAAGGTTNTTYGGMIPFANPMADASGYVEAGPGDQQAGIQPGLIQLSYINNTSSPLILQYLFFDALQAVSTSLTDIDVSIDEPGLGFVASQVVSSPSLQTTTTETYDQFAIALGGILLQTGDGVSFRLQSRGGLVKFDNMAFGATIIPEPTNVMALALLLTSGVMFRNRRRKA